MYVFVHVCTFAWRPEEDIGFPGTRVTDSYELLCRCWELNPLEELLEVFSPAHGTVKRRAEDRVVKGKPYMSLECLLLSGV